MPVSLARSATTLVAVMLLAALLYVFFSLANHIVFSSLTIL